MTKGDVPNLSSLKTGTEKTGGSGTVVLFENRYSDLRNKLRN